MITEDQDYNSQLDKETRLRIEEALSVNEPDRTERFKLLIQQSTDKQTQNTLMLMLHRISILGKHVEGFLPEEHADFQSRVIWTLQSVLGDEFFIEHLRKRKRYLDGEISELQSTMREKTNVFYDPMYLKDKERFEFISRLSEWLMKIIERLSIDTTDNSSSEFLPIPNTSFEGPKPQFTAEIIPIIFDLLKENFPETDYADLENLLKTGGNVKRKLLFKDDAKVLTDAFRKLYEYRFIIGCKPEILILWIINNFQFLYRGLPCDFKESTTKKYISEDVPECRSPLIEISEGKVIKYRGIRKKKYAK